MSGDAYYGGFLYDELAYGAGCDSGLAWALEVDWDQDGYWTGENEAAQMSSLTTRRGRRFVLASSLDGFEPVKAGEFEADILNLDGRYDPFNTSSPLYPNVAPGRPFRLWGMNWANDAEYRLMTGRLASITPYRTAGGVERVKLRGIDGSESLRQNDVSTQLYTGIRVDQAIAYILAASGWTGTQDLDTFTDTIGYWWARGKSAWREIHDLVDASIGKFFIDATGKAKYYSRLRGRSPVLTLTESDICPGIETPLPWEVSRNDVSLVINTRVAQASADLWSLLDKPLIKAGKSLELWLNYQYGSEMSVPATNVITPVATTDYLANSAADGLGSNLTANFSVTAYKFAESCNLVVRNNGGVDGYVTLLKVRGQALTSTPVTLNRKATSGDLRKFKIDNPWSQSVTTGNDILALLYNSLANPQMYPTVRLRANPDLQFGLDLFDLATLDFPSKSIAGVYDCAWIEHKSLDPTCSVFETTLGFEPPFGYGAYWYFPAVIGTSTRFGA